MTLKEVMFWPDRMKQLVGANEEEIESMRKAVRILFGACGVTNEGLCREDWVEANQVFAEAEKWRRKRGEEPLVAVLGNAYFDVLDKDRMKQLVGANEQEIESMRKAVRILFGACGVTEEGLCREDWVEANQVFAEAEKWRRKR